jgi:hypothetical protein
MKKLSIALVSILLFANINFGSIYKITDLTKASLKKYSKISIYLVDCRIGKLNIKDLKYFKNNGSELIIRDDVDTVYLDLTKITYLGFRIHDKSNLYLFFK